MRYSSLVLSADSMTRRHVACYLGQTREIKPSKRTQEIKNILLL